jgi:hypothetical protein
MPRQPLAWHQAVRDLHFKANWRICHIAKAFGVDHAEAWWIVHKDFRQDHDKAMYQIARADPEKWAKRVASQRAYYERKRADPQWRSERSARSARNRAERRRQAGEVGK